MDSPRHKLRWMPATIEVFDQDGSYELNIEIYSMEGDEFARFMADFRSVSALRESDLLLATSPGEVERLDAETKVERLLLMTPEMRATWRAVEAEDETKSLAFFTGTIARYLRVVPGQATYETPGIGPDVVRETKPVVTGHDYISAFCSSISQLRVAVNVVHRTNALSPEEKKALASRPRSAPGSPPRKPAPTGHAPAPTVTGARSKDSAGSGTVPATTVPSPSGSPPVH